MHLKYIETLKSLINVLSGLKILDIIKTCLVIKCKENL